MIYTPDKLVEDTVVELVEAVKATGMASLQRVERQLQQEAQDERPDPRVLESLREEVEETRQNIPSIVAIVTMLAAILVTVDGDSMSVGCDGGIEGAINELRMTPRMRDQWAERCLAAQREVNDEYWGAEAPGKRGTPWSRCGGIPCTRTSKVLLIDAPRPVAAARIC